MPPPAIDLSRSALPTLRRRTLLAGAAAALAGCASGGMRWREAIVDMADGRALTFDALRERVRGSAFVLLGELHDNDHHHRARAALLRAIGTPLTVVAEHLPQGAAPALPREARGEALLAPLQAAGFDARGWAWPAHEPLFAAIADAGHALQGGNLPRELARRVAREGAATLPDDLRRALEAAPLGTAARSALEQDLVQGHCGQLPASRLPNMLWAQRGRDAAMAAALIAARAARPDRPAVLLAGNGHVRRDYGVPTLLPDSAARVLVVGFVERRASAQAALYDLAWRTPAASRDDPCAA